MIEVQVELKRGLQEQEWHTFLTNDLCFEAKAKYSSDFKVVKKRSDLWIACCVGQVRESSINTVATFSFL